MGLDQKKNKKLSLSFMSFFFGLHLAVLSQRKVSQSLKKLPFSFSFVRSSKYFISPNCCALFPCLCRTISKKLTHFELIHKQIQSRPARLLFCVLLWFVCIFFNFFFSIFLLFFFFYCPKGLSQSIKNVHMFVIAQCVIEIIFFNRKKYTSSEQTIRTGLVLRTDSFHL